MYLSLNKEMEAVQFILVTSAHLEKVLSLLESTEPSIHEGRGVRVCSSWVPLQVAQMFLPAGVRIACLQTNCVQMLVEV